MNLGRVFRSILDITDDFLVEVVPPPRRIGDDHDSEADCQYRWSHGRSYTVARAANWRPMAAQSRPEGDFKEALLSMSREMMAYN